MKTMNIRRFMSCTLASCLLMWGVLGLTGCADSEHIDEYQYNEKAASADSTKTPDPEYSDKIMEKLRTIPGISDIEVQTSSTNEKKVGYFFNVEQQVDHNGPSMGTFNQRCYLEFAGFDRPVVLDTEGYYLSKNINEITDEDLTKYLQANFIIVEHRYFGTSLPEDIQDTNFTYFYADQAAADLHAIVTLLQKHLFPRTNKWVAMGVSKGGINATLYAYFSDQNGWDDIDLFVPFCAPFIKGTASSCLDDGIGKYLLSVCGKGYPEGSEEYEARQRLLAIPSAISAHKELRDACLRQFHQIDPEYYLDILDHYNGDELEKAATAGVIFKFYENLFTYFAYLPYSYWAHLVPDPARAVAEDASEEELRAVVEFVFMGCSELSKRYSDYQSDTKATRAHWDDNTIRTKRKEDRTLPYSLQAYRELGYFVFDYSMVDGTWLTPQFASQVGYLQTVEDMFCNRYPGQWDGGQLMTAIHNWAKTQNTKPIIFVYSYNDPWTGAAIEDAAADPSRKVWKVLRLIGTHSGDFLDPYRCEDQASQAIKDAINSVLGL